MKFPLCTKKETVWTRTKTQHLIGWTTETNTSGAFLVNILNRRHQKKPRCSNIFDSRLKKNTNKSLKILTPSVKKFLNLQKHFFVIFIVLDFQAVKSKSVPLVERRELGSNIDYL